MEEDRHTTDLEDSASKSNIERAASYVKLVKHTFRQDPHVYEYFLNIMKDYKLNRISTPEALLSVASLFAKYENLVQGFCNYLPYSTLIQKKGYLDETIMLLENSSSSSDSCPENDTERDDAESKKPIKRIKMTEYTVEEDKKVVERPAVYQNFIELMQEVKQNRSMFHTKRSDTMERATYILKEYPELLERVVTLQNAFITEDPPNDSEMRIC